MESVKAVEHDPYRYGLEVEEVARRRRLVEEVGKEVQSMRQELLKTVHEAQNKGKGAMNQDVLPDPDAFEDEDNDNYAQFEQERQMELMHEQDEALDGVFVTVGNLRQQANEMGRELEEQGEMLNEVDTVTERVGGKLQDGIKRVGWVIKKNEGRFCLRAYQENPTNRYRLDVKLLHCCSDSRPNYSVGLAVDVMSISLSLLGDVTRLAPSEDEQPPTSLTRRIDFPPTGPASDPAVPTGASGHCWSGPGSVSPRT